jgi:hypothetical protein
VQFSETLNFLLCQTLLRLGFGSAMVVVCSGLTPLISLRLLQVHQDKLWQQFALQSYLEVGVGQSPRSLLLHSDPALSCGFVLRLNAIDRVQAPPTRTDA